MIMDYGGTQAWHTSLGGGATAMVHSISEGGSMYSVLQRLTEDMKEMRLKMKRMSEENKHQRSHVVAHAVTSVKRGVTLARVLNPTHQDMTLREGTHLGEFFSMDESEIVPLTPAPGETASAVSATELPVVTLEESPASQSQKEQLAALVAEHREIFNTSKAVVGKCTLIQHRIKTGDHPPVRQRAYGAPQKRRWRLIGRWGPC